MLVFACAAVAAVVVRGAVGCSSSSGGASSTPSPASCATGADCSGGKVCGFANTSTDAGCGARGVCVQPLNPQPTNLCSCDGGTIGMVVDDVDGGVYYWSGVIAGEMGFPPCGDAAIAASSNDTDASGAGDTGSTAVDGSRDASTE